MSFTIGRVIDIAGVGLVLGLLLRWGPNAAQLIATTGAEVTKFYRAVSLQDVRAPGE